MLLSFLLLVMSSLFSQASICLRGVLFSANGDLHRNNTSTGDEDNNQGLMCVIRAEPSINEEPFDDRISVNDIDTFKLLSSESTETEFSQFDGQGKDDGTVQDHALYTMDEKNNKMSKRFLLPIGIFSNRCTGWTEISVKENVTWQCSPQWLIWNSSECLHSNEYLHSWYFYPRRFYSGNDANTSQVPVTVELIDSPEKHVTFENDSCKNVVDNIHYRISMVNGSLERVQMRIVYTNLTKSSYERWMQSFSVTIISTITSSFNDTEQSTRTTKNHLPILDQLTLPTETKYHLPILDQLTLPTGLDCNEYKSISITFPKSLSSGCVFRLSNCSSAHRALDQLFRKYQLSSIFGDNNQSVLVENYPHFTIALGNETSCEVVSSVEITILWALSGPVHSATPRIISILYRYPSKYVISCCPLILVVDYRLRFVQISAQSVSVFARLPTIHLSLPSDFFYPFTSRTADTPSFSYFYIILLCVFIL